MAQPANAVPANLAAPPAQTIPMKKMCAKFRMLRAEGRWPNEIDNIKPGRLRLPRRGVFPGVKKVRHRVVGIPFTEGINPLGVGHQHNKLEARAARLRVELEVALHNLRPVTTLGWGGNGIATLYRYSFNNVDDYFVVKAAIRNDPDHHEVVQDEATKQRAYLGAMHVVQVKGFPPQANMPNPHPANPGRLENVLLLEHLSRGSLHKILCAVTGSGATIPNRVLWLMFRCMVEACIALEYPPMLDPLRINTINGHGVSMATGQPYDERLYVRPGQPNPPPPFPGHGPMPSGTGLVHFDIDPCNILMGNTNIGPAHNNHSLLPVLKVSDLGSAVTVNANLLTVNLNRNVNEMWRLRMISKAMFLTPEQFSEEWEWVSRLPMGVNPPLKTAGKYSALTNLYQFASVMACAITQTHASPKPYQGVIQVPNPVNMSAPRKVISYGAHILEPRYDRVDRGLRQLVAECLCDEPMERPQLDRLLMYINASLQARANSWVGEDSATAVQAWVAEHTGTPPAVPVAPVPAHWVDL